MATRVVRCSTISMQQLRKEMNGCPASDWQEAVADVLPRPDPVLFLNVGSNKGYSLLEFLNLWSPLQLSGKVWQEQIVRYAVQHKHGWLRYVPCGNCNDCMRPLPAPHNRRNGYVHAFELSPATSTLLRHLLDKNDLGKMVTLHNRAVSNSTHPVYISSKVAGDERAKIASPTPRACVGSQRGCMQEVPATTIDAFLSRGGLGHSNVYHISIDVEGYEPMVLDGMYNTLQQKRVAILEFEVSNNGFWSHGRRNRRQLKQVVSELSNFGYTCFWQLRNRTVTMSDSCWRPDFEVARWNSWSNVLCAHEPEVLHALFNMLA